MIVIFCFYNLSDGIQSRLAFSKEFKHCNVITCDGEIVLSHEFDSQGYKTRNVDCSGLRSLLRGLKHIEPLIAFIVVDIRERANISWKPFLVRSCNEIDRYISGVDVGFTFNPKHLYNKLIKYNRSNYDILHTWRRNDGIVRRWWQFWVSRPKSE